VSDISLCMPNRGGAEAGTPELYLTDPDGLDEACWMLLRCYWRICRLGEGLESGALLTRFTPARLVEEELTDLDRLGVLRGPTWRRIPLMEIQRAARSIN
jgi:hypothetical protein